ncbi:Methylamine utilization protein MauG precursor [Shimia sp. SK013]|uniref:cytochrome-c peroxidase n=1 Tax=Shimia sp. SK013 TaxID=1389006 RepID=UPI0006B5E74E|nr:cytochrome c peroxidase [Shimia sp. SK013]KPA22736.1 Methylamine utilization protein MauG precursor [Shimia sp. SK013]
MFFTRPVVVLSLTLATSMAMAAPIDSLEALGEALFHDVNLSMNRTQSCATCHDPEFAFVDPRETDAGRAVSLGDDGVSLGDRNTPTASYAAFVPEFDREWDGDAEGGLFWDGRANTLEDQAGGPPLNPVEMGMADKPAVVARIAENPDYVIAMEALFARGVLEDADAGYEAMTTGIAAFERTDIFAPFDSRYDRYLRGDVAFTQEEELGRVLFFSDQFTNCSECHQLRRSQRHSKETFSNYEYHNIGVPVNVAVRDMNGEKGHIDRGLLANPDVDQAKHMGKFRTPTLRNVAVTAPYMHNGVFEDLRTVVLFYNKYNSKDPKRQINPETGEVWKAPEVMHSLSVEDLTDGPALDDRRIDALVAFMKTLTDARYEHLLE